MPYNEMRRGSATHDVPPMRIVQPPDPTDGEQKTEVDFWSLPVGSGVCSFDAALSRTMERPPFLRASASRRRGSDRRRRGPWSRTIAHRQPRGRSGGPWWQPRGADVAAEAPGAPGPTIISSNGETASDAVAGGGADALSVKAFDGVPRPYAKLAVPSNARLREIGMRIVQTVSLSPMRIVQSSEILRCLLVIFTTFFRSRAV